MNVPLTDLAAQYRSIKYEVDEAVLGVLASGRYILGPHVSAFEAEMASYLGVRYAVGLASGTDALIIALRALGIGRDDEVIVPDYSFFATAGAVMQLGALPVFVDVQEDTQLLDPAGVEAAITPRTRAIIPVHLYGQPADMDGIAAIAKRHGLAIIEDNAQAIGAEFKGRKTGGIGDVGCLSFYPSKNLGAYGDGGMLTTDDENIAETARVLRTHGWRKKHEPETVGYNSRLDELQAAILRVKLKHLEDWIERRREIAHYYTANLDDLGIERPIEAAGRRHAFYCYMLGFSDRRRVQERLMEAGISTEVYFPQALHLAPACRALGGQEGQFPASERASRRLLAVPLYPELEQPQIEYVCTQLRSILDQTG